MLKEIILSNGKAALVDGGDFEFLNKWKWYERADGYAATSVNIGKSQKMMHKMLLEASGKLELDHINGNKIDNRRSNLRVVTKQQNQMN